MKPKCLGYNIRLERRVCVRLPSELLELSLLQLKCSAADQNQVALARQAEKLTIRRNPSLRCGSRLVFQFVDRTVEASDSGSITRLDLVYHQIRFAYVFSFLPSLVDTSLAVVAYGNFSKNCNAGRAGLPQRGRQHRTVHRFLESGGHYGCRRTQGVSTHRSVGHPLCSVHRSKVHMHMRWSLFPQDEIVLAGRDMIRRVLFVLFGGFRVHLLLIAAQR